jgi:VanZ family protein
MKYKNFFKYQFPAIAIAVAIFINSSIPGYKFPEVGFRFFDKLVHVIEFFIFGFFVRRAFFYQSNENIKNSSFLISLIVGILYGISDEVHQIFVPNRNPAIDDTIADAIGVIISQFIFNFFIQKEIIISNIKNQISK